MIDLDALLQPVLDDAPDGPDVDAVRTRARLLHRRRVARRAVAAVAVLALLGGGIALAATRPERSHVSIRPPVPPVGPAPTLRIGAPNTLRSPAMDMIAAFGSIWVSQPDRVARLDATTGRLLAATYVPGEGDYRYLAAGAGSVWVTETATGLLTRIDPTSSRVIATLQMNENGLVPQDVAFVDGKVWVVRPDPNGESRGDIVAVDPATNKVVSRTGVPPTFGVVAGTHALWYVEGTDLVRFDTRALRVAVVGRDVQQVLAVADGRMWLLTARGVVEADEQAGTPIGEPIVAPAANVAVTVGPGVVWVGGQPDSSTAGSVTPYDLTTHQRLAGPTPVGFPILAMTASSAALWVDAGGLTRIPVH